MLGRERPGSRRHPLCCGMAWLQVAEVLGGIQSAAKRFRRNAGIVTSGPDQAIPQAELRRPRPEGLQRGEPGRPLGQEAHGKGATRVPGLWHLGRSCSSAPSPRWRRRSAVWHAARATWWQSFAIARELAHLVYRALRYGHVCTDSGEEAYESRYRQAAFQRLTVRAKEWGYELAPQANAPEAVAA